VARQAVGNQLREQAERALRDRLGGTPQEPATPDGDNAAPKSLENRLKDTLRGLLR